MASLPGVPIEAPPLALTISPSSYRGANPTFFIILLVPPFVVMPRSIVLSYLLSRMGSLI